MATHELKVAATSLLLASCRIVGVSDGEFEGVGAAYLGDGWEAAVERLEYSPPSGPTVGGTTPGAGTPRVLDDRGTTTVTRVGAGYTWGDWLTGGVRLAMYDNDELFVHTAEPELYVTIGWSWRGLYVGVDPINFELRAGVEL